MYIVYIYILSKHCFYLILYSGKVTPVESVKDSWCWYKPPVCSMKLKDQPAMTIICHHHLFQMMLCHQEKNDFLLVMGNVIATLRLNHHIPYVLLVSSRALHTLRTCLPCTVHHGLRGRSSWSEIDHHVPYIRSQSSRAGPPQILQKGRWVEGIKISALPPWRVSSEPPNP